MTLTCRIARLMVLVVGVAGTCPLLCAQADRDDRAFDVEREARRRFDAGRKWAVLIGVEKYFGPGIRSLDFCIDDAQEMARVLVEKCGYLPERVLVITDEEHDAERRPTCDNLRQQVRQWLLKAQPGDTVLVFFSGHGFSQDGEGFLAPGDCRKDNLGLTSLRTSEVRRMLSDCQASQKLLALDCCRAGATRSGEGSSIRGVSIESAFGSAKGLITLAGCTPDQYSHEWPQQQRGFFTHFLTFGLRGAADRDRNGVVDSDELYAYVFKQVPQAVRRERGSGSEQTPVRSIGTDVEGVFPLARVIPKTAELPGIGKELAMLAEEIATLLSDRVPATVAVGDFAGPARLRATAGPLISQILSVELTRRGLSVDIFGDYAIDGWFESYEDPQSGHLGLRVWGKLTDSAGKTLLEFNRAAFGTAELLRVFGATGTISPTADEQSRNDQIRQRLRRPTTYVSGDETSRIFAAEESPYGIEILVEEGSDLKPRSARVVGHQAVVSVDMDEIYAVRLINRSPYDAAVELSIDGLSMFSFSENQHYRYMIVGPKREAVIKGWHRTNQRADAFKVTEYSQSAAAKSLSSEGTSVGTITAIFRAAWKPGGSPPPDEPARGANAATGFGPPRKTDLKEVSRIIGAERASVSVRYLKQ